MKAIEPSVFENAEDKWKSHKRLCIEITEELMKFPYSYLYQNPVECPLDDQVKLLSFPIILQKLNNENYKELKEWIFDVKLLVLSVFNNHKNSGEVAVCYDFIQKFMKKIKRFNVTSTEGWYKQILHYKLKIDSLLQTSPFITKKYFPSSIPQIEYTTKKIGNEQIEYIMKNYQRIQNPNDMHSILSIIRLDVNGEEPENGLLDVNLNALNVSTKCKIYDFMRSRLNQQRSIDKIVKGQFIIE